MRISSAVTLALTALLVASTLGTVVATPATAFESEPDSPTVDRHLSESPSFQSTSQEGQHLTSSATANGTALEPAEPKQEIRIEVAEDGDAHWTIESHFLVTDDEDEALFEEFAEAVVSGDRDVGYDVQTFEASAAVASEATDREMTIQNAGWDDPRLDAPDDEDADEIDDEDQVQVGVISYSFTWTNFATDDDDRIYFGDAFETPGEDETWFPGLADGQRLVVETPPGYGLETPTTLTWDGPHQFEAGDLEIVFLRGASPTSVGSWWILAGVVGLILGAGGYVLYRYLRRAYDGESPLERLPTSGGSERAVDDGAEPTTPRSKDEVESAQSPATGTQIEFDEAADDVDLELLSDEERVHRLLRQNGGRMKQANIVKETGWSNAKVSQLLSQMDDDDEIEKLRIGRENLITLPEVDPTEID
ncbi:helix-turn-helix transcriptional regulator [Natrarchaeobaculum sulfurireducens]|uniref:Transmembrane glycoprotein / HTH domain protein n=1 Tax=Natrarchaeobaculum sulfurireducens TaxID=2044521 RepID=A0A346PBA0_9EURY|nr:hypothetical protein [Natrarchaeobaculum sulfurireducens]AXR76795.1 hypothetical protein AArc1_0451 [Natrarchaeobaculum sulfurireducens]